MTRLWFLAVAVGCALRRLITPSTGLRVRCGGGGSGTRPHTSAPRCGPCRSKRSATNSGPPTLITLLHSCAARCVSACSFRACSSPPCLRLAYVSSGLEVGGPPLPCMRLHSVALSFQCRGSACSTLTSCCSYVVLKKLVGPSMPASGHAPPSQPSTFLPPRAHSRCERRDAGNCDDPCD